MSNVETREWKKIATGIYLVGKEKTVYFRQMIGGKRKTEKAKLQGAAAVGGNGRPTAQLNKLYVNWSMSLVNQEYYKATEGGIVPTFEKLIELYEEYAPLECAKSGRPGLRAQETAVKYFKYLVEKTGHSLTEKVSTISVGAIDNAIAAWLEEGLSKASAKSYATSAKSLTARWAIPKYREEGYEVRPFELPVMKNLKSPRYVKPKDETIREMDDLYESLWHENMSLSDYRMWFFVTMVFKFEVRPGNVEIITKENFTVHNGIHYLSYTPAKTANSSGRHVNWPIHPDYWERIEKCVEVLNAEEGSISGKVRYLSNKFNDMARRIKEIEQREKKIYEWRKLDMHRTFHKFGAEKASAKSGDDIKTITYYYADIAWVDIDGMRLDDLK